VSDCRLAKTQQYLGYAMTRTKQNSMRWWWSLFYTIPPQLVGLLCRYLT